MFLRRSLPLRQRCFIFSLGFLVAITLQISWYIIGDQPYAPNFLVLMHMPSISKKYPTICDDLLCEEPLSELATNDNEKIPKIRHILWKNEYLPAYFAKQLATWQTLQPEWNYILWCDEDLEGFVAKHYPSFLKQFNTVPKVMMKFDMIRYMILHRYGGLYADMDYTLIRRLDKYLSLPAVVTRESEAHSAAVFGMRQWPLRILGNPAFIMCRPGHEFFNFCLQRLRWRTSRQILNFAGPRALTDFIYEFRNALPHSDNPMQLVYVPPSYSFYPYDNNSLATSTSSYQSGIRRLINLSCCNPLRVSVKNISAYCRNIINLDPITDSSQPIFAIHDNKKSGSSYDNYKAVAHDKSTVHIRRVLPNVIRANKLL